MISQSEGILHPRSLSLFLASWDWEQFCRPSSHWKSRCHQMSCLHLLSEYIHQRHNVSPYQYMHSVPCSVFGAVCHFRNQNSDRCTASLLYNPSNNLLHGDHERVLLDHNSYRWLLRWMLSLQSPQSALSLSPSSPLIRRFWRFVAVLSLLYLFDFGIVRECGWLGFNVAFEFWIDSGFYIEIMLHHSIFLWFFIASFQYWPQS